MGFSLQKLKLQVRRPVRNLFIYPSLLLLAVSLVIFGPLGPHYVSVAFSVLAIENIFSLTLQSNKSVTSDFRVLWATYSVRIKYSISLLGIYIFSVYSSRIIGQYSLIPYVFAFIYFRLYLFEAVELIDKTVVHNESMLPGIPGKSGRDFLISGKNDRTLNLYIFRNLVNELESDPSFRLQILEKAEFSSFFSRESSGPELQEVFALANSSSTRSIAQIRLARILQEL